MKTIDETIKNTKHQELKTWCMKDFICVLLLVISMVGGFIGFILMGSEAIETPYALMIMFGFMFLYFFVERIKVGTKIEYNKDTKAKEREK